MKGILERTTKHNQFVMAFAGKEEKQLHSVSILTIRSQRHLSTDLVH